MGRFLPRIAEQRAGRAQAVWHIVLMCCLFAAAPVGLFAQGGDPVKTHCVPTRDFNIPFTPAADPRIVQVLLHASTDKGLTYQQVAAELPTTRRFRFHARDDGWYFFIVQTLDRDGVRTPSDFRGVPPSLRVCVDTLNPVISLRAVPAQDGSPAAIEWSIQDDNFDDVHAEYRSVGGGPWYPLDLPHTATGVYGWTPRVAGDVEVVMQALDKAKRQAEPRRVTVKPVAARAGTPPPNAVTPSDTKYVKNQTFQLDYQLDDTTVGPSDVKNVDIWKMRQGGRWEKCREPGPAKGPATVTVDAPGRWGFRLIPRSGVGLAEPDPRPGDRPDLWIQVDNQPPVVKVTNVVVSPGAESGRMTVFWTASDPFLSRQPMTISYTPVDREEWKIIDKCDNVGSYTCEPLKSGLPYQFRIKVQAVDEAGNVGADIWRDTIKVDLKVPRIKHIDVKPSEGNGQQSQTFSPQSPPQSYRNLPASRQPSLPGTPAGLDFSRP